MTRFRYQALDESGQTQAGELPAESLDVARQELSHRGWRVMELVAIEPEILELTDEEVMSELGRNEPTGTTSVPLASRNVTVPSGKLSGAEASLLAGQMANVAAAGLPLSAGLRALSEEVPSRKVRAWLRVISDRLERGQSLTSVSREATGAWPRYFLTMLEAGQRTGRLSEMLNDCVGHLRQTADARRELWTAMLYPLILLNTAWLLVSFLSTFVLPKFKSIFDGFGTELPGITVALLSLRDAFGPLSWWFLPTFVVGIWWLWNSCEALGWQRTRDWLTSRLPMFGEARRSAALAEFCRLLGLLVRSRVPLQDGIRLAAGSVRDFDLQHLCYDVAMRVDSGQSLSQAAKAVGEFPPDLLHLFQWADRDEDFADGLRVASEVLSAQSRIHAHALKLVCEPTVIVLVGVGVALTVIALFMPLVKLLNDLS